MKFSPQTGLFTVFTIPSYSPQGITAGPDGNLWFTELTGKIARLTSDGVLAEFAIPPGIVAGGITVGKDGDLWFTDGSGIGRLRPTDGTITTFTLPGNVAPGDITAGSDGTIWFTEGTSFTEGNKVGRLSPTGDFREFSVATIGGGPVGITPGPDGNVWFTEWDVPTVPDWESRHDKIARITPAGVITEFTLPTVHSGPIGITTGPDGNLWFAEGSGSIGRITPEGTITEFKIPTDHVRPVDITVDRDGNIWFTDFYLSTNFESQQLGELVLADLLAPKVASGASGGAASPAEAKMQKALNQDNPSSSDVAVVWSEQQRLLEAGPAEPGSDFGSLNVQQNTLANPAGSAIRAVDSETTPNVKRLGSSEKGIASTQALAQRRSATEPLGEVQPSFGEDAGAPLGLVLSSADRFFTQF
jgi:streptogramin lyase